MGVTREETRRLYRLTGDILGGLLCDESFSFFWCWCVGLQLYFRLGSALFKVLADNGGRNRIVNMGLCVKPSSIALALWNCMVD